MSDELKSPSTTDAPEVSTVLAPPTADTDRLAGDLREPHRLAEMLGGLKVGRFSGVFLFALVFAIFAVWIPGKFLTSLTFNTVAGGQVITGVLALAVVISFSAGAVDLSAAQAAGFSSVVCGALLTQGAHLSPLEAILVVLAIGAGIGAINGFFVAFIGVDSFIATLGMTSLLVAGAEMIGNGAYFGPFSSAFQKITFEHIAGIPIVTFYLFALALILWYVLEHTPVGRRLHATGQNEDAARLAGIRTRRYVFFAMVSTSTLAAFAGVLLASSLNSANETFGPQYLLPAFAGAFLGSTQLKPGRFNVWGTILAIYLLGTGVEGLQLLGGPEWLTDLFNGVALLGAVSVAVVVERRRRTRTR